MILTSPIWFLPFLLYAETHYRFKYFFSLLKKHEPEILADAPHRIEPGEKIPILVLVKDAHLYPCTLLEISVAVRQKGITIQTLKQSSRPIPLKEHWWWRIISIDCSDTQGWVDIDVTFSIKVEGRRRVYKNDNYRFSSHRSLRTYVATDPLPRIKGLVFGDCHIHSNYTEDQVEFGVPLGAAVSLSKSIGLSFFCVADHSYDLDDREQDYRTNDPSLRKWERLQNEVDDLNGKNLNTIVVRAEEISARNSVDRNVHLLALGGTTFIGGSGDSAERWFHTLGEHRIRSIVSPEQTVAAFAAHPFEEVPFLQRMLLRRGQWQIADIHSPGLCGVQFLNGMTGAGVHKGIESWKAGLLSGAHLVLIAGNDAHGNFNFFRQLRIPFISLRESSEQIFGGVRTGVFLQGKLTENELITRLAKGNSIVTDGPVVDLSIYSGDHQRKGQPGDVLVAREAFINVEAFSSTEFGEIVSLKVLLGNIGAAREDTVAEKLPHASYVQLASKVVANRGLYIRIEATTSAKSAYDGKTHFCLTNPIWLFPPVFTPTKKPLERGLFGQN